MAEQIYDQRHPHYSASLETWEFNWDHYLGGRQLINSKDVAQHMPTSPAESESAYSNRKLRSRGLYHNLPKLSIDVYQSQIFRVAPKRTLPPQLMEIESDVDMLQTEANDFFRQVTDMAQLFGLSGVLVDAPMIPDGTTELERQVMNLRPWFEYVPVFNVIDWGIELDDPARRGHLNYIVIRDEIEQRPGPFKSPEVLIRYRAYTRSGWVRHLVRGYGELKGEVVETVEGTHPVGEVPYAVFYDERLAPMVGSTIIDDVCLAANSLWNRASVEDESFQYQGFNQLYVKTDKQIGELILGQARAIKLDQGDEIGYLTPSDVPTTSFDGFHVRTVERVADLVFSRTSRQLPTGQVESAEKRRLDRAEFTAMLERKAGNFERAERRAWEMMAAYFDIAESDAIQIEYNREFEVNEDSADEWEKEVRAGIRSRVEWYQARHPGVDDDAAEAAIRENLEFEAELGRVRMEQMGEAFEQDRNAILGEMGMAGEFARRHDEMEGPPEGAGDEQAA